MHKVYILSVMHFCGKQRERKLCISLKLIDLISTTEIEKSGVNYCVLDNQTVLLMLSA